MSILCETIKYKQYYCILCCSYPFLCIMFTEVNTLRLYKFKKTNALSNSIEIGLTVWLVNVEYCIQILRASLLRMFCVVYARFTRCTTRYGRGGATIDLFGIRVKYHFAVLIVVFVNWVRVPVVVHTFVIKTITRFDNFRPLNFYCHCTGGGCRGGGNNDGRFTWLQPLALSRQNNIYTVANYFYNVDLSRFNSDKVLYTRSTIYIYRERESERVKESE